MSVWEVESSEEYWFPKIMEKNLLQNFLYYGCSLGWANYYNKPKPILIKILISNTLDSNSSIPSFPLVITKTLLNYWKLIALIMVKTRTQYLWNFFSNKCVGFVFAPNGFVLWKLNTNRSIHIFLSLFSLSPVPKLPFFPATPVRIDLDLDII